MPITKMLSDEDGKDDLKLRSCMTLFYLAAEGEEKAVFKAVLDKYYSGQQDDLTIKRLGRNR